MRPRTGFDVGPIPPGGSHAVSFGQAGSWQYGCTIHPEMAGTITVLAAGGAGATPEPTTGRVAGATSGPGVTAAATDTLGLGGASLRTGLVGVLATIAAVSTAGFLLVLRRMAQRR